MERDDTRNAVPDTDREDYDIAAVTLLQNDAVRKYENYVRDFRARHRRLPNDAERDRLEALAENDAAAELDDDKHDRSGRGGRAMFLASINNLPRSLGEFEAGDADRRERRELAREPAPPPPTNAAQMMREFFNEDD